MTNQETQAPIIIDMEDVLRILFEWFTVRRVRIAIWIIATIEILAILANGIHGGWSYFLYVFLPFSAAVVAGAAVVSRTPKA